ncbi:hypothetical protein BDM02DRAFT_3124358 [Thelephora ganbajun]|uniref:Uncharacterized protein n=1 Tax=Thelephora ganbajun TaxID=370292 RepID=A0ACB6YZ03_THEGA|nr:hypothetical protein BDM02DRAFT_3124358 [Thelephora ganbajun]
MATTGKEKLDQQRKEQLETVARISLDIRRAVIASLPTPPEQFLSLNVPGKVLNFKDFTDGWDDEGNATDVVPPLRVQLNEAILSDDMPTLSGIQLGPTGRSVAQSYSATLSKFCPAGSTTGIPDDSTSLTDEEKRYQKAMEWLLYKDPDHPKQSRIDIYKEKQTEYTDAFERKTKAFNEALERVVADPRYPTLKAQREAYDRWVQVNQKTYNNHIQAAYMDWVTTGKKEEVEYYFAVVDNDSAMSRVEASKKAMRNAIVSDPDGTVEYSKVILTPSNWAWIALKKMKAGPPEETEETLTYKITRLMEINAVLQGIVKDPSVLNSGTGDVPDLPTEPKDLPDNVDSFLKALKEYQTALTEYQKDTSEAALETANNKISAAREALSKGFGEIQRSGIGLLNKRAAKSQDGLFENQAAAIRLQITANEAKIASLEDKLKTLAPKDNASSFQDIIAQSAGIPPPLPDPPATVDDTPNFWTKITVEVSSSYTAEQTQSRSSSYSVGGSVRWGLLSIGGGYSSSSQSTDAARQMANSSVKVSFECMRVDIARGWLRGELFYDDGLKVLKDNYISPGPNILSKLMDPGKEYVADEDEKLSREQLLQRYEMFPMYPTSFILAANVVLEITGETSDIQSHFATSTTSAGSYIGFGPFSIGGSYSSTSTSASSTCEATANGCKITIKSPQIIGWVSQIVPALPRVRSAEP